MSKERLKKIKLIYGIIMSVLLAAVGISFMVSCVGIYKMGASPFSRERVAEAFSKINILVYVAIAWFFVGVIMMIIFPDEKRKIKACKSDDAIYASLRCRIDMTYDDENIKKLMNAEMIRKVMKISTIVINTILVGICLLITYTYIINSEILYANDTVIKCVLTSLPFMLAAVILGVASKLITDNSYKKSIALAKSLIAAKIAVKAKENTDSKSHEKIMLAVKIAIIAIGVFLVIFGIFGDGVKGTLEKAVRICTECIGLG